VASSGPIAADDRPADCADLVSFLCSAEGGWINGQLLYGNGGIQP
jgi:3-oxoacyl-[acyl-carrier protein] reductase